MESIINTLMSNKILLAVVILVAALIIYSILKRLVKIIVILVIALIVYLGYINYSGGKIDPAIQNYLDKGKYDLKEIQKQRDKLNEMIDTAGKLSR